MFLQPWQIYTELFLWSLWVRSIITFSFMIVITAVKSALRFYYVINGWSLS